MPACSSSSSEKNVIDSTPSQRFFQSSLVFRAPGKRPAIPITATPGGRSRAPALFIVVPTVLHALPRLQDEFLRIPLSNVGPDEGAGAFTRGLLSETRAA